MTAMPTPSNTTARRTLHIRRPATPAPAEAREPEPLAVHSHTDEAEAVLPASSLDSAMLLRGGRAVQIAHNGFVYKLQATKMGKLILTK